MKTIKKITVIIFIALAALFVAYFANRNGGMISVDLIFYSFVEIPIWLTLLFSFLIGIIFSTLLLAWDVTKTHASIAQVKRVNKKLRKKIEIMTKDSHSKEDSSEEDEDEDEESAIDNDEDE